MRRENELQCLFDEHNGRAVHKWHHYAEIYERYFSRIRSANSGRPRILEIGICEGGSLEIWRKYFGAEAHIVGVDIDPACAERVDTPTVAIIGGQSDPAVLAAAVKKLGGGVDLVIDDGSHVSRHQIASFEYIYPRLSERGVYVVDDTHTSYWKSHEGGYCRAGSFMEHVKTLIDMPQAWWFLSELPEGEDKKKIIDFARTTFGIYIHTDLVVVEKRPVRRPFHIQRGT